MTKTIVSWRKSQAINRFLCYTIWVVLLIPTSFGPNMIVTMIRSNALFVSQGIRLKHRIFECPVTQTIRENNQALINDLMDTHKSFLHCPLFPVHDDWTLEQALCLSRGLDYEIEHTCDKVIAYTDGSTIPNNKATHLHSAYAVITIPTSIGEHKREVVEQYKADSTIPAFDVLVLSRVHGHQTNNRAELSSLVHAVASSTNVEAISDSSYAIQVVQDVIAEPDIKAHYKRANIDIIRQLIFYLKSMCHDSIVLRKVSQSYADNLGHRCWPSFWLHCK